MIDDPIVAISEFNETGCGEACKGLALHHEYGKDLVGSSPDLTSYSCEPISPNEIRMVSML